MHPYRDCPRLFLLLSCAVVLLLATLVSSSSAQTATRTKTPSQLKQKTGTRTTQDSIRGVRRNSEIARILSEIDARNIERTIRKLVSFGTRNTLSDQNDPNRGIGAARDWLYAEFQKAAAQSGGRMTVEKQTFEQPKAARVPQPTMLTNIVATLKGNSA